MDAERVLAAIVDASEGNYAARIPLDDVDDKLLEIEVGINFLLDELALEHQRAEAAARRGES